MSDSTLYASFGLKVFRNCCVRACYSYSPGGVCVFHSYSPGGACVYYNYSPGGGRIHYNYSPGSDRVYFLTTHQVAIYYVEYQAIKLRKRLVDLVNQLTLERGHSF